MMTLQDTLGPAHSLTQAGTRVSILIFLLVGFFGTVGGIIWASKWYYTNKRYLGFPFGIAFSLYMVAAIVLMQFW